jgi:hypothetical protein
MSNNLALFLAVLLELTFTGLILVLIIFFGIYFISKKGLKKKLSSKDLFLSLVKSILIRAILMVIAAYFWSEQLQSIVDITIFIPGIIVYQDLKVRGIETETNNDNLL